ncbi:hypothetical protein IEQ34_009803 [Dendrobium chrysotoxum]|uniref:Uncharacterized protein n=1 Tax=Dendrobium chrysotoxum TaxID=161865 RepID=A0AAV7H3H1_DENCH|nr:hypothetical protein IEQ34_009803 [Dendrobium chrysotoxum]
MGKPEESRWNGDLDTIQATSCSKSVLEEKSIKGYNITDEEDAEKKCRKKKNSVPLYKLFSFADTTDILLMTMGSVGALANGAALPIMTILYGKIIQSFAGAEKANDVNPAVSKVTLEYVYLAIGSGVASFIQVACWMATGERQAARMRNLYLKTILRQEIAFFDKEIKTGEVVERISGDTVLIQDALGEKVGQCIQLMSTFFGSFIVAFVQGWLLSLMMICIIPPLVMAGAIMSTVLSRMASTGQTAYSDAAVVVEQTIGSIRTVASFSGEKLSMKKYKNALRKAYTSCVHEGLVAGLGSGSIMLLIFCGYSWGVWLGGKLILDKNKSYTGAKVLNIIFAILTGSLSLGQASPCMAAFAAGQTAAYKMFEIINRKPEIDAYDARGKKLNDIQGVIELRDVYFSYPARPDEQIFKGFSLLINSGTTVALVGESGSGKSTVISLIERFYDPQAGEVLIDGIDIKELQLLWLRGKIGLVSQEPILFASSIKDNISYGKDDATNEEIRFAAELANASKFIGMLPEVVSGTGDHFQGLDTMVGEHGIQLSGGQKQRIAVARAILKNPRILLLDEATSSLDAESERMVQEALDKVMMNRTTVVVAHRLSTVRNADVIAVIYRGSIVEKGSHAELENDPNGAYSQLIRLQERRQNSDPLTPRANDKVSYNSVNRSRRFSQHSISLQSSPGHSSLYYSFTPELGFSVGSASEQENTERNPKNPKEVPVSRLARLNKPEIPMLLLGSVSAIINGLAFPIFGLLLSCVINTFYQPPNKLEKDTKFWSLIFLLFGIISLVALAARSYFFALAGSRLIRRIRLMTFEKIVNMEMAWFDDPENSVGAVGGKLSSDAATIRSLVGDALALIVENITAIVAGLVIAFNANWQLSLIILAMIPLIGLNGFIQMKFLKGFSADAKMMYEGASQVANDAVGSIRTIVSYSAEEKIIELYMKKCEGPVRTGIKKGVISGIGFGVSFFLLYCVYATCFYAGSILVDEGKITFDQVFRVFFALTMAAIGISKSSTLATDSGKAKSAATSVFAVLDLKSKIDPSDDSGKTLEKLNGHILFDHVNFSYPSRPDVQILQDLCLSIKPGKTVALVGESGSGKSTAIALLQRFYDPDSGHVLLDGIELEKFNLRWLRQQIGLVSQEPTLFNDTIRSNIAYGKEGEATEVEILVAAKTANAHKFVCSLQQGYDTIVGERGMQLSGGQKQRVAIARAILKDPKILLFDEATSALDAESERIVQDALDQVMVNRTTVVVAHRLTTIKNADLIAVVKNGVIIEKGTHDKLITIKDGAYASLVAFNTSATTS